MRRGRKDTAERLIPPGGDWNRILSELLDPQIMVFIERGTEEAKGDLYRLLIKFGLGKDDVAEIAGSFNIHNPRVEEWLRTYSFKFAEKVNSTTADALRTAMTEGLNAGETVDELKRRVMDVFGPETSKYRAEMIARTESHRAELNGERELWRHANHELVQRGEQPLYTSRTWHANADACELCESMEGQTVGLDEAWLKVGDSVAVEGVGSLNITYEDVDVPNLHPNCRCTALVVVNPAYL